MSGTFMHVITVHPLYKSIYTPWQVVSSGVRIFTGAECVKWFMKNMVGVTSMQEAKVSMIATMFVIMKYLLVI